MKQRNKIFKFTVTIHTALRTYITIYKSQQKLFYKKKKQYFELVMIPIITERMLKPYWALNLGQTEENFCNFYFCFTVLYFIRIDFELLWTKISSILFIFCWISLQRFYFSAKCSFDAKKYCYIYIFGTEETTSLFLHRTICK